MINHFFKLLGIILVLNIIIQSCSKDAVTKIPDPDPIICDSIDVSFTNDIFPILQQNCYNGCHSGSSPTSGFTLESYEDVKIKIDDNRLLGAVTNKVGFVAMPLGGGRLPDCEIAKIKAWIKEGALDN